MSKKKSSVLSRMLWAGFGAAVALFGVALYLTPAAQDKLAAFLYSIPSIIPAGRDWVDIVDALAPIVISGLAVYYTYVQFKLARKRRADDLFDRRFNLYNRAIAWTQAMSKERGYKDVLSDELALIWREGHFLFDSDFSNLLVEAGKQLSSTKKWKNEGQDVSSQTWPDRTKEELIESRNFFASKFPEELYKVVAPFLKESGKE